MCFLMKTMWDENYSFDDDESRLRSQRHPRTQDTHNEYGERFQVGNPTADFVAKGDVIGLVGLRM